MPTEFTRHAKARLKERHISQKLVEKILANPDKIVHIENDKFVCYRKTNHRTLAVVFTKRREYLKVITVYYENKL